MQIATTDVLYSPQALAVRLDVSEVTVRRWISEGKLDAVRLGDGANPRLRVPESALEQFMRSAGTQPEENPR